MDASAYIRAGVGLLLAGGMLAGCGGDANTSGARDDGAGTGGTIDGGVTATTGSGKPAVKNACGLLTKAEAEGAAGNAVKDGKLLGVVCIWEPVDIDNNANVQVSVGYVPVLGGDPKQMCATSLAGIPRSKPFSGIGNEAYWEYNGGGISNTGSLHVCVDQGMVDTAAIGSRPEADLQRIAVSLARTALDRI